VLQDLLRALPESATGKQAMDVLNSLP
jgi:hypothetical protein